MVMRYSTWGHHPGCGSVLPCGLLDHCHDLCRNCRRVHLGRVQRGLLGPVDAAGKVACCVRFDFHCRLCDDGGDAAISRLRCWVGR